MVVEALLQDTECQLPESSNSDLVTRKEMSVCLRRVDLSIVDSAGMTVDPRQSLGTAMTRRKCVLRQRLFHYHSGNANFSEW